MKIATIFTLLFFILFNCQKKENTKTDLNNASLPDSNLQKSRVSKTPKIIRQEKPQDSIPAEFEPFKGIWIRKDLIHTIQKTQSLFKSKEIIDKQAFSDFLALAIDIHDKEKDTLTICTSTFFTQMPPTLYLGMGQKKQVNGYQAIAQWAYKDHTFYMDVQGEELFLNVGDALQHKRFVFQKVLQEDRLNICVNQVKQAYKYLIMGEYQLLDKNNQLIQTDIRFDEEGNTNFPEFKYYRVWIGYQNSIYHAIDTGDKSEDEKRKMLQNGALDREDILAFYKIKDNYESRYEYVIEKSQEGFNLYTLKEQAHQMWQLLYKKELAYKLIPLNNKKKIK